jgi:16S rRNA (adenine1518-N6/adenine1519-N6)-dimethyltransferase
LRPNKRLGQNFLVDEHHLQEIIKNSDVGTEDEVLEIGAGLGSLTRHLAEAANRVIAVELDAKLLPPLQETLSGYSNINILEADIFSINIADHFDHSGFQVIANIPYYLTSKLIRHLLEGEPKPSRLVLTVQKEVAQRACAKPPKMSLLALSVQLYGTPRIAHHIPAGAFYPVPKVDSALLIVELFEQPKFSDEQIKDFFALSKAAFRQKRKTLANSLAALPEWDKELAQSRLEAADIDAQRRPQTLNLEEWQRLVVATKPSA